MVVDVIEGINHKLCRSPPLDLSAQELVDGEPPLVSGRIEPLSNVGNVIYTPEPLLYPLNNEAVLCLGHVF